MGQPFNGGLSPNPHYYEMRGRAAEIARALGSPAGGAEHLFLGMLHDGGWPLSTVSHLVDLGEAEAAVLGILNSPGYLPPPPPRFPGRAGDVQPWGFKTAAELGDSYVGVEHAFLAMIRTPETVPALALASLADLGALEAAVLAAKDAPVGPGENAVVLPEGQELDGPLRAAISDALPEGTTFGFNSDEAGTHAWITVFGPDGSRGRAVTREVLNTALASLGRPTLPS